MRYRSYMATGDLYDAFDLVGVGDLNEMIEYNVSDTPERSHEGKIEYTRS